MSFEKLSNVKPGEAFWFLEYEIDIEKEFEFSKGVIFYCLEKDGERVFVDYKKLKKGKLVIVDDLLNRELSCGKEFRDLEVEKLELSMNFSIN